MNLKKFVLIAALSAAAALSNISAAREKIIFDTDMGNDSDDAIALVMLYAYARENKADLIGVTVNKASPYAPVFTNILNDYYGARNVPVAFLKDGLSKSDGVFLRQICEEKTAGNLYLYPRRSDLRTQFPDAVKFFRKTLAQSEDKSVSIVSVGLSTILARLLDTPADEFSPLSGKELFKSKVKIVSIMAGKFSPEVLADPKRFPPEWNVLCDVASAKKLFEECPSPIIFSGSEIGLALPYPQSEIDAISLRDIRSPFVDAYNMFAFHVAKTKFKRLDGRHDRSCYDPSSVLCLFSPELFTLSESGSVRVIDEKGRVSFTPDRNGLHRYLVLDPSKTAEIIGEIVRLTKIKPAVQL